MKTLALVLIIVPFWAANALAQNMDPVELLHNSETRTEIFNTILNDHQLMMEFMDAMKNNDHAMMMIQGDSAFMNHSSLMGNTSTMGNSSMMGMDRTKGDGMRDYSDSMMNMMKPDEPGMMHPDEPGMMQQHSEHHKATVKKQN